MIKYIKFSLVVIIGFIFGLFVHGIVEIFIILFLINWLNNFFFGVSWENWVLVHNIFSIIVEILGVILAILIYRKYEQ